jgi:hypothetical protein
MSKCIDETRPRAWALLRLRRRCCGRLQLHRRLRLHLGLRRHLCLRLHLCLRRLRERSTSEHEHSSATAGRSPPRSWSSS